MSTRDFVAWLHIGDLHGSPEDGWESVAALSRIVETVRTQVPAGALDFAFLPGDNADHGEPEQYRRIAAVLRRLDLPCHAIPGDHDFEPGSLARFEAWLATDPLPASLNFGGRDRPGRGCHASFAIAATDGDAPSWRFKPLGSPWPWVLITSVDPRALRALGEHRHSVGAWPEHGLLGTRLGPDANGRDW